MDGGIGYADFLRMVVALAIVLCLIWGVLFIVKKYGRGWGFQHIPMAKRRLKILETLPIGPRQRLMIIKRDDKEHLLVVGQESVTVLEKDIPATTSVLEESSQSVKSEIKTP